MDTYQSKESDSAVDSAHGESKRRETRRAFIWQYGFISSVLAISLTGARAAADNWDTHFMSVAQGQPDCLLQFTPSKCFALEIKI